LKKKTKQCVFIRYVIINVVVEGSKDILGGKNKKETQ